jgi:hypothetical protein
MAFKYTKEDIGRGSILRDDDGQLRLEDRIVTASELGIVGYLDYMYMLGGGGKAISAPRFVVSQEEDKDMSQHNLDLSRAMFHDSTLVAPDKVPNV